MPQKNTTAYVILGLLEHESSSGYDLKKKIDIMISRFWDVGYGQLYPTLKTLEKEGSVIGAQVKSMQGPDRIEYSITDAGRQKLKDWLAKPNEKEYVRYEILLKLFFGGLCSPSENIGRIKAFREQHDADLQLMGLFKSNLESVFGENRDHLYYYLTVSFGEHIYRAYKEWADEAIDFIEKNLSSENGGKDKDNETSKDS
jgi:DNA-binding PadR family transcriptional regulator